MKSVLLVSGHRCPPCKTYTPVLEAFCKENDIPLKVIYVEDEPGLAGQAMVMSTPTSIFIDGADTLKLENEFDRKTGIVNTEVLRDLLGIKMK